MLAQLKRAVVHWLANCSGLVGGSVEQPGGPTPDVTQTPDRHTG